MGELKRLQRMVSRRDLKTQIKLLKQIISTHEPLLKAIAVTKKAYEDGKQAGAQEMLLKLETAEQERLLAEATKKGNDESSNVDCSSGAPSTQSVSRTL